MRPERITEFLEECKTKGVDIRAIAYHIQAIEDRKNIEMSMETGHRVAMMKMQDQIAAMTDWRNHTCGECGYCLGNRQYIDQATKPNGAFEQSPRLCNVCNDRPACPDYVLREVPE